VAAFGGFPFPANEGKKVVGGGTLPDIELVGGGLSKYHIIFMIYIDNILFFLAATPNTTPPHYSLHFAHLTSARPHLPWWHLTECLLDI
jgi:hypothetical protein